MNTADRSIALMDTALRRRFQFIECMPDEGVLTQLGADKVNSNGKTLDVSKMLKIMNDRIEYLYDREHKLGHAFFTELKDDNSLETLAKIFKNKIIPLLQEYFYDDYEKIQLVLGDNGKQDNMYKFIIDQEVADKDLFNPGKGVDDLDLSEKSYQINEEAFNEIESYLQIGKGLK